MATVILRSILFVILTIYVFGDEIEMEVQSGTILKMLREMVNQTASDSLNLPANSTSIRENITDTFSCENRTYGYYADVDNDCQIFHVCLPSQTPSGRNVTYKWSFICPKETVFNQEVLVCTRERDSIPCEESPDFYDLNMEIGKIADPEIAKEEEKKKLTENIPIKKDTRLPNRKKQNLIMEALMKEAEEIEPLEEIIEDIADVTASTEFETSETKPLVEETKVDSEFETSKFKPQDEETKVDSEFETNEFKPQVEGSKVDSEFETSELKPLIEEVKVDTEIEASESKPQLEEAKVESDENSRLGTERSLNRRARKISRGNVRFRSDA